MKGLLILILSFGAFTLQAQEDSLRYVSITGLIQEEGSNDIIRGVKVFNESREYGTLGRNNGFYTIVAVTGDIIRFSAVGYAPLYMKIENEARTKETINIKLEQSDIYIEDVIVDADLPTYEQLDEYFNSLDIDEDPGRELAERNPETFSILDSIDEPPPRGPVSFLKKHVFDKIKQKKRKPGKAKKLPKYD